MKDLVNIDHINKLCLYAARNGLTFKEGEKIIDAAADPKTFRKALLSLEIEIQEKKAISKNELLKMRLMPGEIIALCGHFDASVHSENYSSSLASKIIKAPIQGRR